MGWLPDLDAWAAGVRRVLEPAPVAEGSIPATSYQYGLGQIVDAWLQAGFALETLREYPHANGCKTHPSLVPAEGRRWVWPEGVAGTPLMFALSARRV